MPVIPEESLVKRAEGHQFPGGDYTIEHWENFLLTDCTGGQLMSGGVVHPIALFHVPILGSGTTIAEMFALGQAESDASISIESYDWRLHEPLLEDVTYHITGGITDVSRHQRDDPQHKGKAQVYDRLVFDFSLTHPDGHESAATTVIWHYNRSGDRS